MNLEWLQHLNGCTHTTANYKLFIRILLVRISKKGILAVPCWLVPEDQLPLAKKLSLGSI